MKRPRMMVVATAGLILAASAGCSGPDATEPVSATASNLPSTSSSPTGNLPEPAPAITPVGDGANPQTANCGLDARELGAAVVVELPESDPPNPYGDLVIKYSPGCQVGWARVQGIRYDGLEAHIWLSRPADSAQIGEYVSTTASPEMPVYSDALSANAEACLVGHAFIVVDGLRGPEATTDCLAP